MYIVCTNLSMLCYTCFDCFTDYVVINSNVYFICTNLSMLCMEKHTLIGCAALPDLVCSDNVISVERGLQVLF